MTPLIPFLVLSLPALSLGLARLNPAETGLTTIPLNKQYVPVIRNNHTIMYRTAYFGDILVGLPQPQIFSVVFDTGSGHFFVPSANCRSAPCATHRFYESSYSASGVEIDHDGTEVPSDVEERDQVAIAYGSGEIVGDFARETVCLGNHSGDTSEAALHSADCTRLRVIFATELSTDPFRSFEFDGVLGLGLESLALDPEFSFLSQMEKTNSKMKPLFGVFISQSDEVASEITFGGPDLRRFSDELRWAPVSHPELGYWQVSVKGVTVGGEPLGLCEAGDCFAIADTGTSLVGVPQQAAQHMHWLLARKVGSDPYQVPDCRHHAGPEVVFDLGSVNLTIGPEDYSRPAALRVINNNTNETDLVCRAALLPVDLDAGLSTKTWILGEPVLRKYYTVYDWKLKWVGFSPAAQPAPDPSSKPRHVIVGAPPFEPPSPTVVYI